MFFRMEKQKNTDNQALFLSGIKSDFLYRRLKFNMGGFHVTS